MSYARGARSSSGVGSEPGVQGNFPEIKSMVDKSWLLLLLIFRIFCKPLWCTSFPKRKSDKNGSFPSFYFLTCLPYFVNLHISAK